MKKLMKRSVLADRIHSSPYWLSLIPELMLTVPPQYTAYQGFDALFHSLEVYISKYANLMSDMVAITSIRHIAESLPQAVNNGADLQAREKMAFANTISGYAMDFGSCTSEHSLEHAMSAYHQQLPHGAGLIMISKAYFHPFCRGACVTTALSRWLRLWECRKPKSRWISSLPWPNCRRLAV